MGLQMHSVSFCEPFYCSVGVLDALGVLSALGVLAVSSSLPRAEIRTSETQHSGFQENSGILELRQVFSAVLDFRNSGMHDINLDFRNAIIQDF